MCGFTFRGIADGRFRTVPDRVRALPRDAIPASELQALGVPIGLAFFFRPSHLARYIGVFPGPAGPTEAELPEHVFEQLVERVPAIDIEDDVEALLIRCERGGSCNAWVVPIDVCYELSALMRREWRGIDGGEEGARTLDEFFTALSSRVNGGPSS
jgi:hypothetical protein